MATTMRQPRSRRAPSATDYALHGWADSAEWVEPIERSLAAVSASTLADRSANLYGPGSAPSLSHVLVVIDTGDPDGPATQAHDHRVATMAHLRVHFPFVDAVASVGSARYAILAHRHAGLAGTVASLERRLQADPAATATGAAVWCEELPDDRHDIDTCIRGLRVKPASAHQSNRGELAAGLPVEVLAGARRPDAPLTVEASERRRLTSGRWLGRSAALALAAALLMGGAGTAAALSARLQPWKGFHPGSHAAERVRTDGGAGSGRAGQDMLSLLIPGFSPGLVEELLGLVGDADRVPYAPSTPTAPAPGGLVLNPGDLPVGTSPATPTPRNPDTAPPLPLPSEPPETPPPPGTPAPPEIPIPEEPPTPPPVPELPPPPAPEPILEPVTGLLPGAPVPPLPEVPL